MQRMTYCLDCITTFIMLYIVDVQYYHLQQQQKVVKEATCMSLLQPLVMKHFVFQPPFPLHSLSAKDLRTVNYVHQNLGVVHWSVGDSVISDFTNSLPAASIILCNGAEKSLLLKSILPLCQLVDVNIAFSNLSTMQTSLLQHHHHHHLRHYTTTNIICCADRNQLCSLTRIYQLYNYFMNVSGQ